MTGIAPGNQTSRSSAPVTGARRPQVAPAPHPHHPAAAAIDPGVLVTVLTAAVLTGDDGAVAMLKRCVG
ncbi:hypothetical protein [Streptomyces sp. MA5143a]|uniref:hypothetical protein n=1 Tax=Streptomyces sp. MA5143a TaxID=2083010 RepID=UPI000D2AE23F|nr:hypothetical protein [Streptomyces sp. MA5143a]SPF06345.1 hypothetical protein SMA5143A_7173 [Streptomyces sp. MA5143a]